MNTDEKALEQLARDATHVFCHAVPQPALYRTIREALHKAVEPYKTENAALRKQVEELKEQLESTVKGSFGASQAMAKENASLRAENERLKSACKKSGDVI